MAGNVTFRDMVEVRKMIIWKEWMEERQKEWEELNRMTAKAIIPKIKVAPRIPEKLDTGSTEGTTRYNIDKTLFEGIPAGRLAMKLNVGRETVINRIRTLKSDGWQFYNLGDYYRIERRKN